MNEDLGILSQVGERSMLRFERRLAHPPAEVWRLITLAEGLESWFPARIEIDELAVGGKLRFVFADEDLARAEAQGVEDVPKFTTGVIRELVVERVFAFDWENGPIRIELFPEGEGCRLVFTHIFDRDMAQAPRNATGWHVCLAGLATVLNGGKPETDPPLARWTEAYTAAFREGSAG